MKKIFVTIFVTFLLYVITVQSQATKPKTKAAPKTTKAPKAPKAQTPKAQTPKAETPKAQTAFIFESSAPNTGPGVLDFYYLEWAHSYNAGDTLPIKVILDPDSTAPPTVSLSLFDEFNKVKLIDISANVALKSPKTGVPFSVFDWPIPKQINSDFDFKNHFTIVMSWKEGANEFTKDRRVKIINVTASPGGKPNPAFIIAKDDNNTSSSSTSSASASANASSGPSPSAGPSPSSSPTSTIKFNNSSASKLAGNHFVLIILQIFIIGLYNR